jgi:hypothetical protein
MIVGSWLISRLVAAYISKIMNELIGFGYWRSLYEPTLPDPAWFVDTSWVADERQRVAQYLSQGRALCYFMGFSWCRFRCAISAAALGTADLTDGTYCWPAGLSHYVWRHNLRLPDQIVQHILNQPAFPSKQAQLVLATNDIDLSWWLAQKGWNAGSNSFLSETDQQIRDFLRRYDQNKLGLEDYTAEGIEAIEQLIQELKNTN